MVKAKKPNKTKRTHTNTSKPNTNSLNKLEIIYSGKHFGLYYLLLPEEYCLENP